ncbi:MAG: HAMP domain-containing histidine kinase [Magnetococcales bacterium]|nr:HAMP domain-containing histidine kinase [Magnetococcales bacterium]
MPTLYSRLNHIPLKGKSLILIALMAIGYLAVAGIVGRHIHALGQTTAQKQQLDRVSMLINQLAFGTFELHLLMTRLLQDDPHPDDHTDQATPLIDQKITAIEKEIATLDSALASAAISPELLETAQPIRAIQHQLGLLKQHDHDAMAIKREIGFDENSGIQGRLRNHIHTLELRLTSKNDYPAMVDLLQLRRREKDFIMRVHRSSREQFQGAIQTLQATLAALPLLGSVDITHIQETFQRYQVEAERLQNLLPQLVSHKQRLWEINNAILRDTNRLKEKNALLMNHNAISQETGVRWTGFSLVFSLTLAFLLLGWLTYLFFQSLLVPIQVLSNYAHQIAQGNYSLKISLYGTDEIGDLAQSLQTMKEAILEQQKFLEDQVRSRTEHLEITNGVLNDTIRQLNDTHQELLHSEKMASLGRLVAGFAHEINTPIGIAITTVSNLPEVIHHLNGLLSGEEVDMEELTATLDQIQQSADLGMSSLRRAAELVSRFKRTSIDQTSEETRTFLMGEILQDILATLHMAFKKSNIAITLHCPDGLLVHSQPGLIEQVLINLLMNSHRHGFGNGARPGRIRIEARRDDQAGQLVIHYTDNGAGIPAAQLSYIFDPFYTTAREQGGSGLGLTICYNIIVMQLKGSISCQSDTGQGVLFEVRIPASFPVKPA